MFIARSHKKRWNGSLQKFRLFRSNSFHRHNTLLSNYKNFKMKLKFVLILLLPFTTTIFAVEIVVSILHLKKSF